MQAERLQIKFESPEPEDQTAQAMQHIEAAVAAIRDHYSDRTCWPGWTDDAQLAVRLASQLLMMAAAEATS